MSAVIEPHNFHPAIVPVSTQSRHPNIGHAHPGATAHVTWHHRALDSPLSSRTHPHHNAGMSHADLSAARSREFSDESPLTVARVIARENQLDLVDVRDHEYAGRHQRIALFERADMQFSLILSGRVVLGYNGARFVPSPRQAASCADGAGEYGLPAITEFIDSMTLPQRMAELPAMPVAVEALAHPPHAGGGRRSPGPAPADRHRRPPRWRGRSGGRQRRVDRLDSPCAAGSQPQPVSLLDRFLGPRGRGGHRGRVISHAPGPGQGRWRRIVEGPCSNRGAAFASTTGSGTHSAAEMCPWTAGAFSPEDRKLASI